VPLGFLTRYAGNEPHKVNRICLWSNREGSLETSQLSMFSMSPPLKRKHQCGVWCYHVENALAFVSDKHD
jgi:hypothetical protein